MLAEEIEFATVLRDCCYDGIKFTLDESCMKAILFHLGSVKVENSREFHVKLSSVFGEGAEVLEKIIVKELFRRLNVSYEEGRDFDFERYVNHAREFSTIRLKEAK